MSAVLGTAPPGFVAAMDLLNTLDHVQVQRLAVGVLDSMAHRATRVPVEDLVRELALSGGPVSVEKLRGVAAALWHLFQTVVRRRTSPAKLGDALTAYTTAGSVVQTVLAQTWAEKAPLLLGEDAVVGTTSHLPAFSDLKWKVGVRICSSSVSFDDTAGDDGAMGVDGVEGSRVVLDPKPYVTMAIHTTKPSGSVSVKNEVNTIEMKVDEFHAFAKEVSALRAVVSTL